MNDPTEAANLSTLEWKLTNIAVHDDEIAHFYASLSYKKLLLMPQIRSPFGPHLHPSVN